MERIILISSILMAWFVFANCARIHVVDPLSYAPSIAPSTSSSNTPPSTDDCSNVIFAMADCVPFMTDGSKDTSPDGSCCPGLEMVLKASDDCICEAIESSTDLGIPINMTRAMTTLLSACGISAPNSFSQCSLPFPPGASVNPAPRSPKNPSPKSHHAPTNSVNVVPAPSPAVTAPTPSPNSGTYSISTSLLLILSMVSASVYCVSF